MTPTPQAPTLLELPTGRSPTHAYWSGTEVYYREDVLQIAEAAAAPLRARIAELEGETGVLADLLRTSLSIIKPLADEPETQAESDEFAAFIDPAEAALTALDQDRAHDTMHRRMT